MHHIDPALSNFPTGNWSLDFEPVKTCNSCHNNDGYAAYRTPLDAPFSRAIARVMEEALGQPVILTPSLGGSLPLATFHEVLGAPIIVLPIANHDDNQHAANENLRLQNLWGGIDVMAGLLVRLGAHWRVKRARPVRPALLRAPPRSW